MTDHGRAADAAPPTSVELIASETVYDGYFKMRRYRLRHQLYDGAMSGEMTRELFERGHAVAVLPYDPDRDRVVLIEQFRVGAYVAGLRPWLLEVVAGIIEDGEDAADVARRELSEEAGLAAQELVPVVHYLASPGGTSETVRIFCARVDATGAGGIHGLDHEHEDIRVLTASVDELATWLADGRLANGAALVSVQWLLLNRERLRAAWRA